MNDKKPKFSLTNLFANRTFNIIFSLVLAIFAWTIVVQFIEPEKTTFFSVPVDFSYNSSPYITQGLEVVGQQSGTVSVKVKGNNSLLSTLETKDILVYPDYSSIKGPGQYTLSLKVEKANSFADFTILSIDKQTVDVEFDKVIAQKYPVTVLVSGVEPEQGFYVDTPTSTPAEVVLNGPESLIKTVVKVTATVTLNEKRSESSIATAPVQFWNADGIEIKNELIKSDVTQVEVTIPVLKIKEVPIVVAFSSVPTGFNTEQLGASLSTKTITIAGPAEQVDQVESISTDYVDLSKFELGKVIKKALVLPDGIKNTNGLDSVDISFATLGYTTKTVTVTDMRSINKPANLTLDIVTAKIGNVTLVGEQAELDALGDASVIAQVDASANNISVDNGQQSFVAQIVIPSSSTIFATGGPYTVLCNITTAKTEKTAGGA